MILSPLFTQTTSADRLLLLLTLADALQTRTRKHTTTFWGVRGSVGDTGVSYVFQARNKKMTGTNAVRGDADDGTE